MKQERGANAPIIKRFGNGLIMLLSKVNHPGIPTPILSREPLIPGKEAKKQEKPR